jgi:hypothetical protein
MRDEDLLNLFVCPFCNQGLVYEKKNSSLKYPQCNHNFTIIDGIVDAFAPIEGLKSSNIDLPEQYERWGEFVTRGESNKQRKDITAALVEGNLGRIGLFRE